MTSEQELEALRERAALLEQLLSTRNPDDQGIAGPAARLRPNAQRSLLPQQRGIGAGRASRLIEAEPKERGHAKRSSQKYHNPRTARPNGEAAMR